MDRLGHIAIILPPTRHKLRMITTASPRKTEVMTIHSLHFPTTVLLQELQGFSFLAWRAKEESEALLGLQQSP